MPILHKLYVDTREPSNIQEIMKSLFPNKVEIKILDVGDFIFDFIKYVVITERKSIEDFVNSIRNNRIWEQLQKIANIKEMHGKEVKRKVLLIDGTLDQFMPDSQFLSEKQKNKFYASIMGAIQQIVFVYGVPIIFADNQVALKQFFRILVKREENGKKDAIPSVKCTKEENRFSGEIDYRIVMLTAIPTIGPQLAKNLLKRYRSIRNIVNATKESLAKVPGIGTKRAEIIFNFFRSENIVRKLSLT
ncbi:MAG: ERCC4 domain-containing protein [Candidatus Asgardarchaeia archaeon]